MYAGSMGINPLPLTVGQLLDLHYGWQQDRWDHTVAVLSVWAKNPVRNPYRKPTKRFMKPEELYAIQKAVKNRNAKRRNELSN